MFPSAFAVEHELIIVQQWTEMNPYLTWLLNILLIILFQLSSSEVDHSIDLTLGNFSDAAPLFGTDTKQFIGITTYPTTPIASTRQMPPLAYPQPKQSSAFNSNGLTPSAQSSVINNSCSRTYTNNINNNNTIINNNNTAISNVNSYQQKSASSALLLAPPPQSRANSSSINNNNSSSITSTNNNNFVRPPDSKPLINGRSAYTTAPQLNKHEVNIAFSIPFALCFVASVSSLSSAR